MEKRIEIKAVTLSNGNKLRAKDYIGQSLFEEDILEYISDKSIEYYAMSTLDLNTEEYHLENAYDSDLVEALENNGFNFISEVDESDMIDYLEQNGYKVLEEGIIDNELDTFDSNRLEEIKWKYIYGSWSDREKIYDRIVNG